MTCNALNRRKVLDVRIGRPVQAHVAVAALQNGETLLLGGHCIIDKKKFFFFFFFFYPRYVSSRPDHASFMQNEPPLAINGTPLLGWVRS